MKTKKHISRVVLAAFAVILIAGACGSDEEPASSGDSTPPVTSPSETTPEPSAEPTPEEETVVALWYASGEFIVPTFRSVPKTARIGTVALEALMEGPVEEGYTSAIPDGVQVLGLRIDGGNATVDVSSDFEEGGGSLSMRMRVAQVVYTLTEFPTVRRVFFEFDGSPVEAIGGEGVVVGDGVTEKDFEDLVAPITVETPIPGATVSSPVRIAGTANVFEATVSIQILDANGDVIKEDFTTATCGTGCRGDYQTKVAFDVTEAQEGTIVVFESSAQDGSMLFPIEIPVTLQP